MKPWRTIHPQDKTQWSFLPILLWKSSKSHLCWVILRTHWDSVSHSVNQAMRAQYTQAPSRLKWALTGVPNTKGFWCTSHHWYQTVLEAGRSSSLELLIWTNGYDAPSSQYHCFLKQILKMSSEQAEMARWPLLIRNWRTQILWQ